MAAVFLVGSGCSAEPTEQADGNDAGPRDGHARPSQDAATLPTPTDGGLATDARPSDAGSPNRVASIQVEITPATLSGLVLVHARLQVTDLSDAPLGDLALHWSVTPHVGLGLDSDQRTRSDGSAEASFLMPRSGRFTVSATVEDQIAGTTVGAEAEAEVPSARCISARDFYERHLWPTTIQTCRGCHNGLGLVPERSPGGLVFPFEGESDFFDGTEVTRLAQYAAEVTTADGHRLPYFLAKPTGPVPHGGGTVLQPEGAEAQRLAEFATLLRFDGLDCDETPPISLFQGVTLEPPQTTLNRATAFITTKPRRERPSQSITLGASVQALMSDPAHAEGFGIRLKEMWNDQFFTRHLAVRGLSAYSDFRRWFFIPCDPEADRGACCEDDGYECCLDEYGPDFCERGTQDKVRLAASEAPLELIREVVQNDLPFTEVLRASHPVVNPFLAAVYNVPAFGGAELGSIAENHWAFADAPARSRRRGRPTIPHAGILNSPVFLARYPTSPANLNRARSRLIYDVFLGIDVLDLVRVPSDPAATAYPNPTMDDPTCASCHAMLDPLAASFQHWQRGDYDARMNYAWDSSCEAPDDEVCVRPQAFGGEALNEENEGLPARLRWLADRIAAHEQFAYGVAKVVHRSVSRSPWLPIPSDPLAPEFEAQWMAYRAQINEARRLAQAFRQSGHDFKVLIREAMLSKYFRASAGPAVGPIQRRALEIARVGHSKPRSPEQLDRRLRATTGYSWTDTGRQAKSLFDQPDDYKILYGGIDSRTVFERAAESSQVMQNIARQMAVEMACTTVGQEFSYIDASQRRLLSAVEPTDTASGSEPLIREVLADLHWKLLSEDVGPHSQEVAQTFSLFQSVQTDEQIREPPDGGLARLSASCRTIRDYETGQRLRNLDGRRTVRNDPAGTINAWVSVFAYLLADDRFLYE